MSALLPALVGLLVVFVPGFLVTLALRIRGFDAFAIAPPVSIALIAVSAIIAPALGLAWALWIPFALAAVIALLGFLVQAGFAAFDWEDIPGGRRLGTTIEREPMVWSVGRQVWLYASVALGALLGLRNLARSIGDAEWISQTWDNSFHLNAVRYIVDHSNASPFFILSMTSASGEPEGFYPLAWHNIVSLVFMYSGESIPVATNATVLVIAGVVWPLSVIYMVRSIFPARPIALVLTGVASASISSFPYSLVYFGVLYPNLLGYSLIPVGIGMMAQLFRVGLVRYLTTVQAVFLGILVALGIALAHPNAIMSMLVLVLPIFATRLILQIIAAVRTEIPWWVALLQGLGILAIFAVVRVLWDVVRPPKEAGEMWGPALKQGQAIGELVFNHPLGMMVTPLWVITIIFFIGAYYLVTCKNRLYWVVGSWLVLVYFYVAVRSLAWEEGRYEVVGTWYHDSYRLAALAPILVLIFIAYGVHQVALLVMDRLPAAGQFKVGSYLLKRETVVATSGVVATLVLTLLLQTSTPLNAYIKNVRALYEPTIDSPLLTPDELDVLERVDDLVPEDKGIVVSAFNGGAFAYALAGREVTSYHTLSEISENDKYIYENLDKAQTDPRVCQILDEENISYFLWFGWVEVNNDGDHAMWYPSFERLWDTEGVIEPVYRSGGATLYEIVACD
ncbi:DUF6541 family protein [Rothia nasimurium]|uniref:DUF6541 family protein n=1 Tax=Rothia nasimurium TaxID=85336 RepID=UPI002DD68CB5|nr:DUF6541 family protein [Rothia nasimurium]